MCDICSKMYKSQHGIDFHKNNAHSENTKTYKCGTCWKEFSDKDHYVGHVNTHILHKPNECGKKFYYKSNQ